MQAKTLIFGAGWIGRMFAERIPGSVLSHADIADPAAVEKALQEEGPSRVLNCAAKSGKPNIDSCERDPQGTERSNYLGALVVAKACVARGIYLMHMSSGCIYNGDKGGDGFSETDPPNFSANVYARSKIAAERDLSPLGVLLLRIRMPFSEKPSERNLLTKLIAYRKVLRQANSVTVVEDFVPAALALLERSATGIFNMVNPGVEYHDEVLAAYREQVDPTYRFEIISPHELTTRVLAPRSNCLLNTDKLAALGLSLPPFSERLPRLLAAYAKARA